MKPTKILPLLLAVLPFGAHAFEAIDTLPWPGTGIYPAYPVDAEQPFALWAQAGYMYDSNVFRQATAEQSEQIYRIGGGVRNDFRVVGRQRLRLQAEANAMLYQTFGDNLDHVAYGLLGEWRYEVGNDLAGTIGYTRRHFQADLAEVARGTKDLITENRFYANGAYRLGPTTRVRGAVDHTIIDRPQFAIAEVRATGVTVGADYVSALNNTIGLEARAAHGDAPIPEAVAVAISPSGFANNDYNTREVAAVAGYNFGPMLRASGRVGQTRITYSELPGRDFSGASLRGHLEWLPGTKTILALDVYDEPRTIIDVAATHAIVKGASFGASWAASQKLVFSGRFLHENRDFEGDPATIGAVRKDTVRAFRFGSGWEVQRHIQLGFAIDRGIRDSSALGRDYRYTAVMANVRYNY